MKIKITIALLLTTGMLMAQSNLEEKTKSYSTIAQVGTKEQKDSLAHELYRTAKLSKSENELELISNFLFRLGYESSADSLVTVIAKKFPKGLIARGQYIQKTYHKLEGSKAKEKSYNYIIKNWPIKDSEEVKIAYDYVISDLTRTFLAEGNKEKALYYIGKMNERFWRAQAYIPVATKLLEQGDTTTAISLVQTAIDDAEYYINLPKEQQDNRSGFAGVGYPGYVSQMVSIYNAQGRGKESLQLIEHAIRLVPSQSNNFSATYFKELLAVGRKLEALQQLENIYKQGTFTYKSEMQKLYIDLNGSDSGYQKYIDKMDQEVVKSIREHIAKSEKNQPAPNFELLNLKGEKVTLASLKGKVIVMDFWATWCQPCVRSFPGMQAAQEMYKFDNEVKFIFINTWERDKNYKENVAAFIAKNNYPFEVLYDDVKDMETGQVLAARMGVNGIPAKFIIDKEGNIRYALAGSSSNVDYIKLEMKELIEAAKKKS